MQLSLGVKTDPIEYRFSYDWLFDLLGRCGIDRIQLGSMTEIYSLEDVFFLDLRERASRKGLRFTSCFTSHRELGGFFTNNRHLEKVARRNYERYIEIGALLGVDFVGSNPGAVYRDQMDYKPAGIECYLHHMRDLMAYARDMGLKGLTAEPMSSLAEPPATPDEITYMMECLSEHHGANPDTVPVYLCGDISHGYADRSGKIVYDNYSLFECQIPFMAEFHLKNTDSMFHSTFGFTREELKRGIVDLQRLRDMIHSHSDEWPVNEVTGYLEIGGPKLGRDYSDYRLESMLVESLETIQKALGGHA